MNDKFNVVATGIPVAIDISAKAGDMLLIVHGVCVGVQPKRVYTSTNYTPSKVKPRGGKEGDVNSNEAVLQVLGNGPLDTSQLLDALNLHKKDPRRKVVMQRVQRLKAAGTIKPVKADKDAPRPRWEIA